MVKQSDRRRAGSRSITVPIFVDSVKTDIKMTRLNFLVIAYEDDHINWNRDLEEMNVPYVMIGPFCVVCNPMGRRGKFNSLGAIEDFFGLMRDKDFWIESRYTWLPNSLLRKGTKRGDCYRVDLELLMKGFLFTNGKIPKKEFLAYCKDKKRLVSFEAEEAEAFRSLGEEKVKRIRAKRKDLLERSKKKFDKLYLSKK
jgi:hypothetical protein